jgi:hypothetical protein
MNNIYTTGEYLSNNSTWHEEDSPWKAGQILQMIKKNSLAIIDIAEIGCGVGEILVNLRQSMGSKFRFSGYDIAPAAIARARTKETENLHFFEKDLLNEPVHFDLLLVIDVVEHVRNYYDFLEGCRDKATYKLFHIPLDLHVSSVLRGAFVLGRKNIGHIHYFSQESALESLKDTGYRIVDATLTDGVIALSAFHPSIRRRLANIPRVLIGLFSKRIAARLLGGYSLLVLCE